MESAILSVMAAAVLTACGTAGKSGSDNNAEASKIEMENIDEEYLTITDAQRSLLKQNNGFALKLFNEVAGLDSRVVSPLSVSGLMCILANGADGQTRQEILSTLGWGEASLEDVNAAYAGIIAQAGRLDPSTTVSIADYIAVNKGYNVRKDFAASMQGLFKAEVASLDFNDEASVKTINKWCGKKTDGMIPQVIDHLDPSSVACLMNAIFFKGSWKDKFDSKETKLERFQGYTRDIKKVQMMHRDDDYLYLSNDTYSAVSLPYGNGTFSMTVLLPNEGRSISEMMETLDADAVSAMRRTMQEYEVDLKLPKFTTEVEIPLNDAISSLGCPSMFGSSADFSKIADGNVFVSKMLQKAKIEVSEEGTKAAAVTVAIMTMTALAPEPVKVEFHADRPFVYFISDSSTGAIYFIGQFTGE